MKAKGMNICFYSPYIPKHFGGGEKHLFDTAIAAATKHSVTIALPSDSDAEAVKEQYQTFLGTSLSQLTFVSSPLAKGTILTKIAWTAQFDVIYYVTDGSFFFTGSKKRLAHIQIPFSQTKTSLIERLKLTHWKYKNTNSAFTKKVIEKSWNTSVQDIHYPMVILPKRVSERKQKVILSVGRFFTHLHAKRQDVVVQNFRKLCERFPKESKGWKLVLVGNVENQQFFDEVVAMSKGLQVEIYPNATTKELTQWYKDAQIYWHAAGFGVDESKNPENVEHFGITTLEAMSYGVVPVVHKKGGQPEVLGEKLSTYLWNSPEECIAITAQLLRQPILMHSVASLARQRAKHFGEEAFVKRVLHFFEL